MTTARRASMFWNRPEGSDKEAGVLPEEGNEALYEVGTVFDGDLPELDL
jgi:hypothetical protein